MKAVFTIPLLLISVSVCAQAETEIVHICAGDTLRMRAYSPDALSYQWYKNEEILEGATDALYTIRESGTYTVEALNAAGCTAQAIKKVLIIQDLPKAVNDAAFVRREITTPIPILNNDITVCSAIDTGSYEIVSTAAKGNVTVHNGVAFYMPFPLESGIDTFTYRFADEMGTLSNIATVFVTIDNDPGVVVFPNPVDHEVNIKILDDKIVAWKLIDVLGRVFMQENVVDKGFKIDISHLAAAPYIFTFYTSNKMVYNVKIIKR